jgi:hypothetical protein
MILSRIILKIDNQKNYPKKKYKLTTIILMVTSKILKELRDIKKTI